MAHTLFKMHMMEQAELLPHVCTLCSEGEAVPATQRVLGLFARAVLYIVEQPLQATDVTLQT